MLLCGQLLSGLHKINILKSLQALTKSLTAPKQEDLASNEISERVLVIDESGA
jgi:hypothetical protein